MPVKAGIDIGSVTTKCVIVEDEKIIAKTIANTGIHAEETANQIFTLAIKESGRQETSIETIVLTGYGRRLLKRATKIITEISAAGYGAYVLTGYKPCLIIDVGGQDTKIIEVDNRGGIIDFLMNDKCAAGTGRFLEMMAQVLGTDFDGFSQLASKSNNPVEINSTCSVFAESEVISLLSRLVKKEDIAQGLFQSIAVRISAMLRQFSRHQDIVFCGGGAKSQVLKYALEKAIDAKINVLDNAQFVTAFGAAISS